jgi:hypothetical protein
MPYCGTALPNSGFEAIPNPPHQLCPLLNCKAALPGGNSLGWGHSLFVSRPTADPSPSLLVLLNWLGSGGSSELSSLMIADIRVVWGQSYSSRNFVFVETSRSCARCSLRREAACWYALCCLSTATHCNSSPPLLLRFWLCAVPSVGRRTMRLYTANLVFDELCCYRLDFARRLHLVSLLRCDVCPGRQRLGVPTDNRPLSNISR